MQLFNFDLIIPEQQLEGEGQADEQQQEPGEQAAPPLCYVVDINYFPGVDKIVDFEQRFVALLWEGEPAQGLWGTIAARRGHDMNQASAVLFDDVGASVVLA